MEEKTAAPPPIGSPALFDTISALSKAAATGDTAAYMAAMRQNRLNKGICCRPVPSLSLINCVAFIAGGSSVITTVPLSAAEREAEQKRVSFIALAVI